VISSLLFFRKGMGRDESDSACYWIVGHYSGNRGVGPTLRKETIPG